MQETNDAVSLGRLVNEMSRTMTYFISRRLAPYGLNKDAFDVLSILSRLGSIEQGKLIEHMKCEKYTATKILSRLQEKELLYKERDAHDRRRLHLFLTEEGEKLIPVLDELKKEITATLAIDIEFDKAAEILQQMTENMRSRVTVMKEQK